MIVLPKHHEPIIYKCNDIPNHCCGFLKNNKECTNKVSHIFQFSNDEIVYTCGVQRHIDKVLHTMDPSLTLNVYEKTNNKFYLRFRGLSCLDMFMYNKAFYGPLTELQDLVLKIKESQDRYVLAYCAYIEKYKHFDKKNNKHKEFDEINQIDPLEFLESQNDMKPDMQEFIQDTKNLKHICVEYNDQLSKYVSTYTRILPYGEIETNGKRKRESSTKCSICLSNINEYDGGHTDCNHPFHHKCMNKWLKICTKKKVPYKCPNCRRDI